MSVREGNKTSVFDVLIQQQHMIAIILIMFYVFLEDDTHYPILHQMIPTLSIPHPSIPAPNQTSVATYSKPHHIPDSIPNDKQKNDKHLL